jgi:hypothetical protein
LGPWALNAHGFDLVYIYIHIHILYIYIYIYIYIEDAMRRVIAAPPIKKTYFLG